MGAYQCWCDRREKLRAALNDCEDASSAAYQTRHALAQVEQNTMAEQTDDLLRQQTGILFSCCKSAVGLMDITVTSKVWVAQSAKTEKRAKLPLVWIALAVQLAAGLIAYTQHQWLVWLPIAASMTMTVIGLFAARPKKAPPTEDQVKVTEHPDADKLLAAMDAQMQAIDRYINDFAYLNEQSHLKQGEPDASNLSHISEMLEVLYDCEGETRAEAIAAAERLLQSLGMRAVEFSKADARLFTVLPSKTETRTLAPAIVSAKDGRLLQRGTAAAVA